MMSGASNQKQEEIQPDMARKEKEKKEVFDLLFDAAIKKNWTKVVEAYKKNPSACLTKLTKSEQTALHMAVSCYKSDSKKSETRLDDIKKIVNAIPEDKAKEALELKDANGNTPLHLAARQGSVSLCEKIALGRWKLIGLRNNENETPLFLAAHRGKMDAFFCLLKIYKKRLGPDGKAQEAEEGEQKEGGPDGKAQEGEQREQKEGGPDGKGQAREGEQQEQKERGPDGKGQAQEGKQQEQKEGGPDGKGQAQEGEQREQKDGKGQAPEGDKQKEEQVEPEISLCRGKDGKTVLHSAISGEYYELAYRIIKNYPDLVDSKTVDGESPLHFLARKPNSFKSSSHLRFYDSIIYQCVYVPELYVLELKEENSEDYTHKSSGQKPPLRYPRNYETCVGFCELVRDKVIRRFSGYRLPCRHDEESGQKKQEETKDDDDEYSRFPANYATFIRLSKFMIMFLLVIFGIGYQKIDKMREKKRRHKWATQIMNKMIGLEKSYKYDSTGQEPTQKHTQIDLPPVAPPTEDDSDTSSGVENSSTQNSSSARKNKDEKERVENGSDEKGEKFLNALRETAKELNTEKNFVLVTYDKGGQTGIKRQETPFLIAAKTGITEMVEKILDKIEVAIHDVDKNDKNALLLAVEHRQTKVFHSLLDRNLPEFVIHQVDSEGNSARHLAALFRPNQPWRLPGAALQMHGEVTWFKHVKKNLPPLRFSHYNKNGETPRDVFRTTHEDLTKDGTEWLIKASESCSFVAALIAGVAFATSVSVPGGINEDSGQPRLVNYPLFNVFSISSLVALCFSLTALVCFLAIITSRCQVWDFKKNLPRKLLMGLSCLFTSIAAILVSFCAGHFFVLKENLQYAALPIYAVTSVPLTIFLFAQLPLYFDLMQAVIAQVPVRSYKVFYR